jgi:hypothetical protein
MCVAILADDGLGLRLGTVLERAVVLAYLTAPAVLPTAVCADSKYNKTTVAMKGCGELSQPLQYPLRIGAFLAADNSAANRKFLVVEILVMDRTSHWKIFVWVVPPSDSRRPGELTCKICFLVQGGMQRARSRSKSADVHACPHMSPQSY